jgi:hypothetical protein
MAPLLLNFDTRWKRMVKVFIPRETKSNRRLGGGKIRSKQYGEKTVLIATVNRNAIPCVIQPVTYLLYRPNIQGCGTFLYSPYIIQGYKTKFHLTPVITSGINYRRQSASPTRTFLLSLPLSSLKEIRNLTRDETLDSNFVYVSRMERLRWSRGSVLAFGTQVRRSNGTASVV